MEYATLNNGLKMPMEGIGTFLLQPAEAEESVYQALKAGYRLVDTANAYMNEKGVGRGIKKSGVKREDIFLVTRKGMCIRFHETDVRVTGRVSMGVIGMIIFIPLCSVIYSLLRTNINERLKRRKEQERKTIPQNGPVSEQ